MRTFYRPRPGRGIVSAYHVLEARATRTGRKLAAALPPAFEVCPLTRGKILPVRHQLPSVVVARGIKKSLFQGFFRLARGLLNSVAPVHPPHGAAGIGS
jgi:hypothetical protein